MRLPKIRLPRPSVTIPKVAVKRKTYTLSVPKIDAKPLLFGMRSYLWRLVPDALKLKIARYQHRQELQRRMSDQATSEYIDLDWNILHAKSAEEQHLLAGNFLGMDMDEKAGHGFFGPVEKHIPIPPRSAMIGTGIRVAFDPETGEEISRVNV